MTKYLSNNMKRIRYYGLDIGKFMASILVISIHTMPFVEVKGTYVYKIWDVVSSLAVPFFFVCSGLFIGDMLIVNDQAVLRKKALYFMKIYLLLTVAYLPLTIFNYIQEGDKWTYCLLHFFRGLLLYGNHGWSWHLWYLLCASYSLFALFLLYRMRVKNSIVWIIAVFFYIFGIFMTYQPSWATELIPDLNKAFGLFKTVFWNGRMFTGLFWLLVGMQFNRLPKLKNLGIAVALALSLVASIFVSEFADGLIRPVIIVNIVLLLKNIKVSAFVSALSLNKISTYIYYIHMYFVFVVNVFFRFNEKQRFFIVSISSIMASYAYLYVKRHLQRISG